MAYVCMFYLRAQFSRKLVTPVRGKFFKTETHQKIIEVELHYRRKVLSHHTSLPPTNRMSTKKLNAESRPVLLLREWLESGWLTGKETPITVQSMSPLFVPYKPDNFRRAFKKSRKETGVSSGAELYKRKLTCY